MRRVIQVLVGAAVLGGGIAAAEHDMMGPGRMGPPSFLRQLFVPAVIMEHQTDIGLSDEQRQAISKEMNETQKQVLDLRWQLEEKTAALDKLLASDKVDETAALARVDELMKIEEQLKRAHLGLLIRVKNLLTPAQQATLRKLEPRGPRGMRRPGPPPGPEGMEP
jgi:Spy/CpxP family protein refolding chaperone